MSKTFEIIFAILFVLVWGGVILFEMKMKEMEVKEEAKRTLAIINRLYLEDRASLHGWCARDKNGSLFFHIRKPHREFDCVWTTDFVNHPEPEYHHLRLPDDFEIEGCTWDGEPIEVELKIVRI